MTDTDKLRILEKEKQAIIMQITKLERLLEQKNIEEREIRNNSKK